MSPRPTLHDVASHAGVSKSTVSRVINDHPHVGGGARSAVERAMRELGYERNELARSLRTNASMSVGLIVNGLRNEVFAAIAQGVENTLIKADRQLVVASSDSDITREERAIREFQRRGVDGLILTLVDERAGGTLSLLKEMAAPIVLIDRDAKRVRADRVLTDHRQGLRDAIDDLHHHGHSRIGLLSPPIIVRAGREVTDTFIAAGGSRDFVRHGPLIQAFGYAAVRDLLSCEPSATALIVSGTQVLVGVLTALEELHLRVPHDLSLISYDDSAAAKFHTPPISTLARDTEEIGAIAARLVLERIDKRRSELKKVFVPTVYVPRGSVSLPGDQKTQTGGGIPRGRQSALPSQRPTSAGNEPVEPCASPRPA